MFGELTYIQVSAGGSHTVMLRSDGTAVASGSGSCERCDIPALVEGLKYIQVAAGGFHTVLLRSDGTAVACGDTSQGQCNIPALDGDMTYIHVAAGMYHTVLVRSDGTAVSCGGNANGQCDVPSKRRASWLQRMSSKAPALHYVTNSTPITKCYILQAFFSYTADGNLMHFSKLSGEEQCSFGVLSTDRVSDILTRIRDQQGISDVVFHGGQLLSQIVSDDPLATLEPFIEANAETSI